MIQMLSTLSLLLYIFSANVHATSEVAVNASSTLGICGYQATCSAGGHTGVCVSIGAGCCNGGTTTAGLCPGSSDIKCCTTPPCSTPKGSGSCMATSECKGTAVAGYCAGPPNVQCCVGTSSCILGTQNGCSGSVAAGVSNQITSQLQSMGYSFKSLDTKWIHCPGGCMLQSSAADRLAQAAASKNDYITLNSAYRTSAEQYLLYQWYKKGMCGITLAAQSGQSNHEGGRAVDTSNYNYWLSTLNAYGWVHTYPSTDPVHFDYGGAADIAKQNLLAFQKLWNKHNPNSKLTEDGIYGPATENALYHTPCNGW